MKIDLAEHFLSLQGESTHAGRRCYFLRLAGCNLRCRYCDTQYAWERSAGTPRETEELTALVLASGCPLVEVTGGEPLIQEGTPELCRRLLDVGLEVLLETNGSLPLESIPPEVRKIVDCKLPGSGMADRNCTANYARLLPHDEVKFVTGSREDFDFAMEVIRRYRLAEKTPNLLFSPVWGRIAPEELARWVIDSGAPIRMQLQMHKVLWGNKPGV